MRIAGLFTLAAGFAFAAAGVAYAQQTTPITPGDNARCVTRFVPDGVNPAHRQHCATLTPTPTKTATPTPTATPSGHPNTCHAPTTHDHGDCAPQWVLNSPMAPTFEGPEAHVGFKGFLFEPVNGVDAYMIVHLISTPTGRQTQFHTYKVWLRDPTGAVSYYHGLMNTGDPLTTRISRSLPDPGFRPIVLVVDQAAYDAHGPMCEVWYTAPTVAGPTISWLICPPVYLHDPTDTADPTTWTRVPGNFTGVQREADLNWYVGQQPEGSFANGYTAPTLKNYAQPDGFGNTKLFFRHGRVYSCLHCVVPN